MRLSNAIVTLVLMAGAAGAQPAPPVFGLLGQTSQMTAPTPVPVEVTGTASDGLTAAQHVERLRGCNPAVAAELERALKPEDLEAAKKGADAAGAKGYPLPGGVGEITQCTTHFTCGAASIEVWTRLNRPAELARIAHQLVCDGRAPLTATSLKVARGSRDFHAGAKIWENDKRKSVAGIEDRTDLDILVQSALMDKIAIGNWSAYDVDLDSGGLGNTMRGNSGAHPLYLKREMERLTGQSWSYEHDLNPQGLGGIGRFFGNLRVRTPAAKLAGILVARVSTRTAFMCFQTKPTDAMALHWVTVVANDGHGGVYYVDTCETKSDRSKLYKMSKQDLIAKVRCVVYAN